MTKTPEHLTIFSWYEPHQQWLKDGTGARADLTGARLTGAILTRARLTDAILTDADLTDARLTRARLTGARLTGARLTGADLTGARLTGADLARARLTDARLTDADLTGARLTDAILTDADLTGARLTGAALPAAPVVENLHSKMLEVCSAPKALDMATWHTCETTHCRAGWAITLAGDEGAALEKKFGSAVAGTLIYHASTGTVPNFYDDNETAMADIKRCAAL
jgi:hypothetical protein